MWHTGDTKDHVKLIRLRIFRGTHLVADSGHQLDNTLRGGGRLGVFCFSQEQLIWSDLSYTCRQRVPQQIYDELPPNKQNQVEADPALPWESTSNSVRWDDKADDKPKTRAGNSAASPKASAKSAVGGTSKARSSVEKSQLYDAETQKCFV